MEIIKFKLNEAIHSAYLYCESGDFEHLADIFRILFWNGKGEEVEESEPAKNVIFVDWSKHEEWKEFKA